MIVSAPGRLVSESLHLFSGKVSRERLAHLYQRYANDPAFLKRAQMEEGRIYSFQDFHAHGDQARDAFYDNVIRPSGVRFSREMKVTESSGVSCWIKASRSDRDFDLSDSEILGSIAPVIRSALRNYVALERAQQTSELLSDAMRRLYCAWITLDADGRVLDYDAEVEKIFSHSEILRIGPSGRLIVSPPDLAKRLHGVVSALVADPQSRPHAVKLSEDPWLDVLLMPVTRSRRSASPGVAVVGYLNGDSWQNSDRCAQLIDLFGLSEGQARMALALARGLSIYEAAEKFGIKPDSARKYSKSIYAKIGARGLPDLVRIVMRSVIAFAPDR